MFTLFLACSGPSAPPVATTMEPRTAVQPNAQGPAPEVPGPPADEPLPICVNEWMAANVVAVRDEAGVAADWIELHNPTDTDVLLDGWSMSDDPAEPHKHVLGGGLVLEAGGYLVLWADDQPGAGPTHLGFALADDGDAIGLYAPSGAGSVVRYTTTVKDVSVARAGDCCFDAAGGCFGTRFGGTPGAPN